MKTACTGTTTVITQRQRQWSLICCTGTVTALTLQLNAIISCCVNSAENKLVQDKGVKVGGVWIDLNKIKIPSYFISAKETILPYGRGTYRGALNTGGNKTYVLGESGHIAGIVNHPDKKKYGFWLNDNLDDSADSGYRMRLTMKAHGGLTGINGCGALKQMRKIEPFNQGSELHL
ncbi:hypothetical protein OK016_23525 [Vibrio chagasii]|nr:hypothetical protein [Vibrio chagasii]